MNKGCNGQIPSCVRGHAKANEGPYPVVVEWGYEHCGGTTSSENISPSPFVQVVIYVVYVTACIPQKSKTKIIEVNKSHCLSNYIINTGKILNYGSR